MCCIQHQICSSGSQHDVCISSVFVCLRQRSDIFNCCLCCHWQQQQQQCQMQHEQQHGGCWGQQRACTVQHCLIQHSSMVDVALTLCAVSGQCTLISWAAVQSCELAPSAYIQIHIHKGVQSCTVHPHHFQMEQLPAPSHPQFALFCLATPPTRFWQHVCRRHALKLDSEGHHFYSQRK
jgi:hypothetical protein